MTISEHLRTLCERGRIADDLIYNKMSTVSEKYAKRSNHYTAKIDLFSITMPIAFRLFAIAQLSLS